MLASSSAPVQALKHQNEFNQHGCAIPKDVPLDQLGGHVQAKAPATGGAAEGFAGCSWVVVVLRVWCLGMRLRSCSVP